MWERFHSAVVQDSAIIRWLAITRVGKKREVKNDSKVSGLSKVVVGGAWSTEARTKREECTAAGSAGEGAECSIA